MTQLYQNLWGVFDTDFNAIVHALLNSIGNGVLSGLDATVTGLDLVVTVALGNARANNTYRSFGTSTNISFVGDPDATNPKKALIVIDSTGAIIKRLGVAEPASPSGDVRRNTLTPTPPALVATDLVLFEVWLAAGATAIVAADVSDRRNMARANVEVVEHVLPRAASGFDLGSTSLRWRDAYLGTIELGATSGIKSIAGQNIELVPGAGAIAAVNSHFRSFSNGLHDLGQSGFDWNDVYARRIFLNSDVNLYRFAADALATDDLFIVKRVVAGDWAFNSRVSDINRFVIFADGTINWLDAVGSIDTNLYRSAANILKTDDQFDVGGGIVIGTPGDTNLYRGAANSLRTDDELIVLGLTSETALGVDNARLGISGGTPRLILEDATFTQWIIDNASGKLRIYNPGVERMNVTTAGFIELPTVGAGILIGGDTQIFRGAANRLDLASGDSLNLVGGDITLAAGNTVDGADISKGWVFLAEGTGEATNVVEVSWTGNYNYLKVIVHVNTRSSSDPIIMRVGISTIDTATNYAWKVQKDASAPNSATNDTKWILDYAFGIVAFACEMTIINFAGWIKRAMSKGTETGSDDTTLPIVSNFAGVWNNQTGTIKRVRLNPNVGTFSGVRLLVLGKQSDFQ